MNEAGVQRRSGDEWLATREVGNRWGLLAVRVCSALFGRRPVHSILWCIAFWYTATQARVRRVSQSYMARAGGRADFWGTVAHVYRFAQCTLDRLYFLAGRVGYFEVTRRGPDILQRYARSGRGAILLGAHFGSFEAMRAVSIQENLIVNVLAHEDNARKIAAFLGQFSDESQRLRVIAANPSNPAHILKVKERIDAGEFVAILGDRTGLNERRHQAEFLGATAEFPTGPWLIAALLRCPVLFVVGCFEAPNRYHLRCEERFQSVELPRGRRQQAMGEYVEAYVHWLEGLCRERPDNWFNFYDFWPEAPEGAAVATELAARTDHV